VDHKVLQVLKVVKVTLDRQVIKVDKVLKVEAE
jgi:hypothetical protein